MHTQQKKRRPWGRIIILVLLALIAFCVPAFKIAEANFYMERTPEGAGFTRIIHKYEKVYGFGPGGNETIVVIFNMQDSAAKRLQADPDTYFADMLKSSNSRRRYSGWKQTPMPRVIDPNSAAYDASITSPYQTIDEFLNRYGFGYDINLSPADKAIINTSLSSPGSFYSGRGGRLFLIIPEARRGVYIHVG